MKVFCVFIDGSSNDRESLANAVMATRKVGGRLDVVHATGQPIFE